MIIFGFTSISPHNLIKLNTTLNETSYSNLRNAAYSCRTGGSGSNYLGKLYIELKNKPITMSDDYNEAIYQKLTPLIPIC